MASRALPKPRTRKRKRLVEVTEHECIRCGTWFIAQRADARFCGANCKVAAHRERRAKPKS